MYNVMRFILLWLPVIYFVCRKLYYFGEGATEGYTWLISRSHTKEFSRTYHFWRECVENMGARLICLAICVMRAGWMGLAMFFAGEATGIVIYELKYRDVKLGSWRAYKAGSYELGLNGKTWFSIPYPQWKALLMALVILLIIEIMIMRSVLNA